MTGAGPARRSGPPLVKALSRALGWRCPACGEGAMFDPVAGVNSWVDPRERCDRCGLRFHREPGYYLLANFAGSYGLAGASGIATWILLAVLRQPTQVTLPIVLSTVFLVAVLSMRHTKSVYLAIDLVLDPPRPEDWPPEPAAPGPEPDA